MRNSTLKKSTPKKRTTTKFSKAAAAASKTKSILHYFSPQSTPVHASPRTSTKSSKAAAVAASSNTKSILHYFSPQSTPGHVSPRSVQTRSTLSSLSEENSRRKIAFISASGVNSIRSLIGKRTRDIISNAVSHQSFRNDSTNSNQKKQANTSKSKPASSAGNVHVSRKRKLNADASPIKLPTDLSNNDDDDTLHVDMSQDSFLDAFDEKSSFNEHGPFEALMQPSISNSCWRALNSTEPHQGLGLLAHMTTSWNIIPNGNLVDNFSKFLLDGPEREGINIKEPHRTELAFFYMTAITGKLIKETHQIKIGTGDLERLLLLLPEEECALGDKTESEIFHLAQSFQFWSKRINYMATSLTAELDDIINGLETDTEKLNCMPFASQLLTMDLSESLSMSVRSSMRLLLRYGSWFLDDTGPTKKVASANQQLCTKALLSFIMDLGTIISNAAFLFCARKGIPFADEQCCQVIKDCIDRAIASLAALQ